VLHQLLVLLGPAARRAGLHPTASFNLGEWEHDYRVADAGLRRNDQWEMCTPTAALVVEVISPGDETYKNLPFYAAHGVDELLIVDPHERTVQWFALAGEHYQPVETSGLIELGPSELAQRIDWP
jgi:Uma2 family endonuclease